MSDKGNSKVKALFTEIKTHWRTPAKGKYVPYKEYADILLGVGSNYVGQKTGDKWRPQYDYMLFKKSVDIISLLKENENK